MDEIANQNSQIETPPTSLTLIDLLHADVDRFNPGDVVEAFVLGSINGKPDVLAINAAALHDRRARIVGPVPGDRGRYVVELVI
jgi:hypothetical protein